VYLTQRLVNFRVVFLVVYVTNSKGYICKNWSGGDWSSGVVKVKWGCVHTTGTLLFPWMGWPTWGWQ